jgi:outer membrane protein TolC
MKKLLYGYSLTVWGLACLAGAQTLTLEQAIRTTWENSAQLQAQKNLAGIFSDDTWRRFVPEEPSFSYTDDYSQTFYTLGLSLTYPFPLKSIIMNQLDCALAEQQRFELTAQKYDLAVAIAQAYMNGATAQAMIEFQRQNVQDLETITEAIRLQYVHGQSNQTQKISAELQLTQAQRDLKTAQDQLTTAVELYARLMKIPSGQVTGFELPEDVPPSIIRELGDRTSGQLRDRASVDVGEATRATGFWNQFPDPTFSFTKDYYDPNNAIAPYNDSPTQQPNDYNLTVSFTLPILFPVREVAEAQRSENQGIVAREQARLQLLQDNSAQEAGVLDYKRSMARFHQLHDRDLLLAETMRQAAVEAYKRGQLHFADLMLARQTYASLKTEDIQIRQEIVTAHLAGLRELGNPGEAPVTGASSPAAQPTPAAVADKVETPSNVAITPVTTPTHLLGSPDGAGLSKPTTMDSQTKASNGSEPAKPQPTPTLVTGNGVGETETK